MRKSSGTQNQPLSRRDFMKKSAGALAATAGFSLPVLGFRASAAHGIPEILAMDGGTGGGSLQDKIAQLQSAFDLMYVEGDVDKICEQMDAPGWIHHGHYFGIPGTGEGHRQFIKMMRKAFPDGRISVDDLVEEEDVQVRRWTFTGTHTGELRCPWFNLPPTGGRITIAGNTICRMEGERVAEEWEEWNTLETLVELGVLPPPPYGPLS